MEPPTGRLDCKHCGVANGGHTVGCDREFGRNSYGGYHAPMHEAGVALRMVDDQLDDKVEMAHAMGMNDLPISSTQYGKSMGAERLEDLAEMQVDAEKLSLGGSDASIAAALLTPEVPWTTMFPEKNAKLTINTSDPGARKDDTNKEWSLSHVPIKELRQVFKVFAFGARKYSPRGYEAVENGAERYLDAANRHIVKFMCGSRNDSQSGLHHLAHACCSLLIAMWHGGKR